MDLQAAFAAGARALEVGDLASAERIFRGVLDQHPRSHHAWNALAAVALRSGMPDVAVERARQALTLDKRNAVYLNNLGVAYGELGKFSDAEEAFQRALKARPGYCDALFNLAKALYKRGDRAQALVTYGRAYALDANFPGLRFTYAHALRSMGQQERAIQIINEATVDLQLAPLLTQCRIDVEGPAEAIASLKALAALHSDNADLQFSLSSVLLANGHWKDGWRSYLYRRSVARAKREPQRISALPADLTGKTIWLHSEQGLGDVLFFLRFAPSLRARGARVWLATNRRLASLVAEAGIVDEVVDENHEPPEPLDHMVWIGDLPFLLGETVQSAAVKLRAREDVLAGIAPRLRQAGPPPYLAVTWRAGTDVLRGKEFGVLRDVVMKEAPLTGFASALRGWQGTVLSLQRHPYDGELGSFSDVVGSPVHDISDLTENLQDLLGVLALVDEHAGVSSTNMHILAGLGKSARVLVPHPAEWRWLRAGNESPWFPGFPLYRQHPRSHWNDAFARLRGDLVPNFRARD